MSKTIALEELPTETRSLLEKWMQERQPILLSRDGQPFGEIYPSEIEVVLSPEEQSEMEQIVAQGRADFAAGNGYSLQEIKELYAEKLQRGR